MVKTINHYFLFRSTNITLSVASVCSLVCGFEVQQDGHEQQTYISELTPLDKEMRKNVLARDILQVLTLITRLFMINLQTILPDYP